jgi:diguanylate cyclase (GGDEF)-like protein
MTSKRIVPQGRLPRRAARARHKADSPSPEAGPAPGDPEQLLDQAWRVFYLDHIRAEELGRELLRITDNSPDHPLRGYAWFHVAFAQIRIGDAKVAAEANEQARAAFSRHNDLRGLALCGEVRAIELRRAGRLDDALRQLEEIATRPGLQREAIDLFINYNSAASTHKLLGHVEEPLINGYRALDAAERVTWPGPKAVATNNLGAYHFVLCNFEQARLLTEIAFDNAREAQARGLIGACGANLIEIYHASGMAPKAAEMARWLLDNPQQVGWVDDGGIVSLLPGELERFSSYLALGLLCGGDIDAAQDWLERGAPASLASGDGVALWATVQALCFKSRGATLKVRELVERTLDERARQGLTDAPYDLMRLHELAADACEALGDMVCALAHFRRVRQLYETTAGQSARASQIASQVDFRTAQAKRERDLAQEAKLVADRNSQRLEALNLALQAKVAEAEQLQTRLREQVLRDTLTGLYNRRYLYEAAPGYIELAHRQQRTLCVALIDIDRFKQVNDTHGHHVGDLVLQGLARLLTQRLRKSDIVCRYGGEEFAVVMPEVSSAQATALLERLMLEFAKLDVPAGDLALVGHSYSAGVAEFPSEATALEPLLRVADTYLYRAKEAGRARVAGAADSQRPAGDDRKGILAD